MRLKFHQSGVIVLFILETYLAHGAEVTLLQASTTTNLPAATLRSPSPTKSLAMLLQVIKQLEHYVSTTNLSSIHSEDEILIAASTELFSQANQVTQTRANEFKAALSNFCQQVSMLHLAGDLSRQIQAEAALREVRASFEKVKGYFPQPIVAAAEPSLNNYSCPFHPEVTGTSTDYCPKCGAKLDLFCRLLPSNSGLPSAGQPTIQASVRTATPLTVGQPATVYLQLRKANGIPVQLADLFETHTRKIHLLILDQSFSDYHHEHPQPTRKPGEYSFTFTPRQPGSYQVWADLRPYPLGFQEFARTDIAAPTTGKPLTDRSVSLKTQVDGLNYEILLDQPNIRVGKPASARLRITTPDGKGFTNLEPIMAAFAHMVGFHEDYQTVLHLHPKGPAVLDPAARGGPELEFMIYASRPGFVRVFVQVQIQGRSRFAPFGLQVVP